MAHIDYIQDNNGDVVDHAVYCSDSCHREHGKNYNGWNGCLEISVTEPCALCGVTVQGLDEE
jgi:hypothetical protein